MKASRSSFTRTVKFSYHEIAIRYDFNRQDAIVARAGIPADYRRRIPPRPKQREALVRGLSAMCSVMSVARRKMEHLCR